MKNHLNLNRRIATLALALLLTGTGWAQSGSRRTGDCPDLNTQQREEIRQLRADLRDQGATREEIHGAMEELFARWDIPFPEHPGTCRQGRGPGGGPFMPAELIPEQRDELHALRRQLRDSGATRREIHAALVERLEAWGIDGPEPEGRGWGRTGPGPERRKEGRLLRTMMREEGASPEEIHIALRALREDACARPGPGKAGPRRQRELWDRLSDDQRKEIHALVRGLRDEGSGRDSIREAVDNRLWEWGIDPEPGNGKTPDGDSAPPGLRASNHPNPFNPATQIHYTLEQPTAVTVRIYNLGGREIWQYAGGSQAVGNHEITWNGVDAGGRPVPSGVYYYAIETPDGTLIQSMLLLK